MKPEIKKILFASDLSENARRAFTYALNIAESNAAGIVIFHVLEDMPGGNQGVMTALLGEERMQEMKTRLEERARETLIGKKRASQVIQEAFGKMAEDVRAKSGSPAATDEIVIAEGDISWEIVQQAEKMGCDLIVMGSRKHGLLTKSYLGTTIKYVLKRSKIPVLVVPPADKG